MAQANLGAVSEVTAAGVIGTGTHNTGIEHGILPTQVGSLLGILGIPNLGILQYASEIHAGIAGMETEKGILGIFQSLPQFWLCKVTFPSSLRLLKFLGFSVLDQLDEHLRNSQYFRFLWFPHTENVRIIYQDPTDQPPRSSSSWFWDYAVGYYLLEFLLWISSFFPGLVSWINRAFFRLLFSSRSESVDRSHRILNYECRFRQHVQDWAIPIGKTKEALLELKAELDRNPGIGAHFPVEIRFCRRDEIPLSPCFRRDSCYINVIMYRLTAARGRIWS
ncbi:L-gulonolactone oxidase-like [Passer montanus]|uniref:L-gulonolactone oxidase-like n=1 Tax=Passer montanus TaxID=9160 RepID=UPI00195F4E3E|nr:L-gulonolactone oxidase-like [Passer montanus]